MNYLTFEEFDIYLSYLKEMGDNYFPWRESTARKEHIDEYGETIQINDVFYKRDYGPRANEVFKMSESSMEKLLYLLFHKNHKLQAMGQDLVDKKRKAMQEAVNSIR